MQLASSWTTNMKSIYIISKINSKLFVISYKNSVDKFDSFLPQFNNLVSSFKYAGQ